MDTVYVQFTSVGLPTLSDQCTTIWPDSISCNVPISGMVSGNFINLMVMIGVQADIEAWIAANLGKVTEITEDQANILGQTIVPSGTISEVINPDGSVLEMQAGTFTVETGLIWTEVQSSGSSGS